MKKPKSFKKNISKKIKNNNINLTQQIKKDIQELILMDDEFFNICFKDNEKAVTCILRVILDDENLEIIDVKVQEKFTNLQGHAVFLDIIARNKVTNTIYNIEIQRAKSGASPERARYHVDIYDVNNLKKNHDFKDLPTTFVIFITETDVFGEGLPIYKIHRVFEHNNKPFNDRSYIYYVNGEYKGDDNIGKLIHDFKCKNPDEFYFDDLAEKVKFLKTTEEGFMELSPTLQKTYNKFFKEKEKKMKERLEKKLEKKITTTTLLETAKRMIKKGIYSLEEIADNLNLPLKDVKALSAQMA